MFVRRVEKYGAVKILRRTDASDHVGIYLLAAKASENVFLLGISMKRKNKYCQRRKKALTSIYGNILENCMCYADKYRVVSSSTFYILNSIYRQVLIPYRYLCDF